ncbi:MAG: P-type DNA transfer ATPase VirB11 [Flavisolibacter sp.]
MSLNVDRRDQAVQQLLRPLRPYLDQPEVTELTVNQPCELWTKTFTGWVRHDVQELTGTYLHSLAIAVIVYNGIQPKSVVSVILPEGQRGQIVQPPACIDGTLSLNIRKHAPVVKDLEELAAEGAFTDVKDVSFNKPTAQEAQSLQERHDFKRLEPFEVELLTLKREGRIVEFLKKAVLEKRNMVIAGKTGSGKTTFARSLIEKVPTCERIITIEDVHELSLANHPNRVHMLYGYGAGRITADECLASCMRQSPDRIFLAELRGNEAWEYLNSLNTGHPGSITTTHANNALQTFERIATLIKKSDVGRQLDLEMIKLVLYTTLDVILYFQDRKLVEIFYDPVFAKEKMA